MICTRYTIDCSTSYLGTYGLQVPRTTGSLQVLPLVPCRKPLISPPELAPRQSISSVSWLSSPPRPLILGLPHVPGPLHMSQEIKYPSQPAGDNPAGRTRGIKSRVPILSRQLAVWLLLSTSRFLQPHIRYQCWSTAHNPVRWPLRQQRHTFKQPLAMPLPVPTIPDWLSTTQLRVAFWQSPPIIVPRSLDKMISRNKET